MALKTRMATCIRGWNQQEVWRVAAQQTINALDTNTHQVTRLLAFCKKGLSVVAPLTMGKGVKVPHATMACVGVMAGAPIAGQPIPIAIAIIFIPKSAAYKRRYGSFLAKHERNGSPDRTKT